MPSVTRSQRGTKRIAEEATTVSSQTAAPARRSSEPEVLTDTAAQPPLADDGASPANASTPTQEYGSDGENVAPEGHVDVVPTNAEVSIHRERVFTNIRASPSAQILRELSAAVNSATQPTFLEDGQDNALTEATDGHAAPPATTGITVPAAEEEPDSEREATPSVENDNPDYIVSNGPTASRAEFVEATAFATRRLRSRSVIYPAPGTEYRITRAALCAQLRPIPALRVLRERPVKAPERYVPDPDPTRREAKERKVKGSASRSVRKGKK